MQRKEWHILQPESEKVRRLAVRLDISETLASILVNRGLAAPDEARSFLNPSLEDLHDPFLMSGMDRAVDLLRDAVSAKAPSPSSAIMTSTEQPARRCSSNFCARSVSMQAITSPTAF